MSYKPYSYHTREESANAILYMADSKNLHTHLEPPNSDLRVFKIGTAGGVHASFDCCERLNGRCNPQSRLPRPMGYDDWRPIQCLFVAADTAFKDGYLSKFEQALHTRLVEFEKAKGVLRSAWDIGTTTRDVLSILKRPKTVYGAESEIHAVCASDGADFQQQMLTWSNNFLDEHKFESAKLTFDEIRDKVTIFMAGLAAYVLDDSRRISECGGSCLNGKLKTRATMCAEAFG